LTALPLLSNHQMSELKRTDSSAGVLPVASNEDGKVRFDLDENQPFDLSFARQIHNAAVIFTPDVSWLGQQPLGGLIRPDSPLFPKPAIRRPYS
jgi:hypothetical protein